MLAAAIWSAIAPNDAERRCAHSALAMSASLMRGPTPTVFDAYPAPYPANPLAAGGASRIG